MSVPESYRVDMGRCPCGVRLTPQAFRDRLSYREAHITGLCQTCQDWVYLAYDEDGGRRHPIVDGALVAVRALSSLVELVVLPFRLVVPGPGLARLVWEARFITRAGPSLEPFDLATELEPMSRLLAGHQVRMHEHAALDDPAVTARLSGAHLLVFLDRRSVDAATEVCRIPDSVATATLAEDIPWAEAFGRPLRPLDTWYVPSEPLTTLRVLALMGMFLVERGRDGRRPLDHLVEQRPELFREPSDGKG